jgi:hypothetical protein
MDKEKTARNTYDKKREKNWVGETRRVHSDRTYGSGADFGKCGIRFSFWIFLSFVNPSKD